MRPNRPGPPASPQLRRDLVLLADRQPDPAHGQPGIDRLHRATPAERGEDVVAGDALGAHRAEVVGEAGPELLQAHASTLARLVPGVRGPRPLRPRAQP